MRRWIWLLPVAVAGCGKPAPSTPAPETTPTPAVQPPPANPSPPTPAVARPPQPKPTKADPPPVATPAPPTPPAVPDVRPTMSHVLDLKPVFFGLAPDGGTFWVRGTPVAKKGGDDETAYFDVATGKRVDPPKPLIDAVAKLKEGAKAFTTTPDGARLVIARDATLEFVKTADGTPAAPPATAPGPILQLSDPFLGATRIATLHAGGKIVVWDLATGKKADEWAVPGPAQDRYDTFVVAPDGRALAITGKGGNREIWDFAARTKPTWVKDELYYPLAGGAVFYKGSDYKTTPTTRVLYVLDLSTGQRRCRLVMPTKPEAGSWLEIKASSDGKRVVLADFENRTVHVWDVPAK